MTIHNSGYKKSWRIALRDIVEGYYGVAAVDSRTGYFIAQLLQFTLDGTVYTTSNAKQVLASCGYDPGEHGNTWTDDGRLVISTEN